MLLDKRLYYPLHLHKAGTFYQHRDLRPQGLFQLGQQFLDALEMHGARTECLDRVHGQLAQTEQAVDAGPFC